MKEFVKEIFEFLNDMPEVQSCKIYGSLSAGNYDEFSDLDLVIDVSGIDNGMFLTKLPQLFEEKYDVIFYDYTPSLARKYVGLGFGSMILANAALIIWFSSRI